MSDEESTHISWYSRVSSSTKRNVFQQRELKKGQALILLCSPQIQEMKIGSVLTIKNYRIAGDEFGTASKNDGILIDGKAVKAEKDDNK